MSTVVQSCWSVLPIFVALILAMILDFTFCLFVGSSFSAKLSALGSVEFAIDFQARGRRFCIISLIYAL